MVYLSVHYRMGRNDNVGYRTIIVSGSSENVDCQKERFAISRYDTTFLTKKYLLKNLD